MTDDELDALSDYDLFFKLAVMFISASIVSAVKARGELFASKNKEDLELRCDEFVELLDKLLFFRPFILKSTIWTHSRSYTRSGV